jgi:WD40 repeat protein
MTQNMPRFSGAALLVAFATLFATLYAPDADAKTGKLDEDLQRAQQILTQLTASGMEQGSRDALEAELAGIEAHEYVAPVKLKARQYTSGSGYFPVTVSKAGLLEPALVGRIEMSRAKSRRAKSKLNPAYATVRVRVGSGAAPMVTKAVTSLWVRVDGDVYTVSSEDARIQAAEPAATPAPIAEQVDTPEVQPTAAARAGETEMRTAIARAQEILALTKPQDEFETTQEYDARAAQFAVAEPELHGIWDAEYRVRLKLTARSYNADREVYPVTISHELLAARQLDLSIPRARARAAKSQLTSAIGIVRVMGKGAVLSKAWVVVDRNRYPMTLTRYWMPRGTLLGHDRAGISVAFHPHDPDVLASTCFFRGDRVDAGVSGAVRLWNTRTGGMTRSIDWASGEPTSGTYVVFSPSGDTLAVGGDPHRKVDLWNTHAWDAPKALPHVHYGGPTVFSPDGERLYARVAQPEAGASTLHIWVVEDGTPEPVAILDGSAWVMTISPHGDQLLLGNDGGFYYYDVESKRSTNTTPISDAQLFVATYSSDGRHVYFGDSHGVVYYWDVAAARVIASIATGLGHLTTVVDGPGGTIIVGGRNGVRVYEGRSDVVGQSLDSAVAPAALNADGTTLATGSASGTQILLWSRVGSGAPTTLQSQPVAQQDDDVVHIPNPSLEAAIRDAVGRPEGDLTPVSLASLDEFRAESLGIADLTGLEFAVNLRSLSLSHNKAISDLSPLAGLVRLESLGFSGNQVDDLRPLAGLKRLEFLALDGNPIQDFSPLSSLPNLAGIHANRTGLRDLSPLAGLVKLTFLALNENGISDISILAALPNLNTVTLEINQLRDVSALAALTKLKQIDLRGNRIDDISPLMELPRLQGAHVAYNPLGEQALREHVPALRRRGVKVTGVEPSNTPSGRTEPTPQPEPVATQPYPEAPTPIVADPSDAQVPDSTRGVPATALIVGISTYDNHARLVNPTIDARAVDKELREVFRVDTTMLVDPTKVEFLAGLHALADREYAEDE